MKFINYLSTISNIGIFPMISLMVFFVFFVILGIKVYTMSKETISHAGMLPLEDASRDSKTNP